MRAQDVVRWAKNRNEWGDHVNRMIKSLNKHDPIHPERLRDGLRHLNCS